MHLHGDPPCAESGSRFTTLLLTTTPGFAHYNMLLPDKPWAEKDEKITFTYQFGHPYEHELFDAPRSRATITSRLPDGETHASGKIHENQSGSWGRWQEGGGLEFIPTNRSCAAITQ